eukprot:1874359-Pleurochrysis_carterae.AAC.5
MDRFCRPMQGLMLARKEGLKGAAKYRTSGNASSYKSLTGVKQWGRELKFKLAKSTRLLRDCDGSRALGIEPHSAIHTDADLKGRKVPQRLKRSSDGWYKNADGSHDGALLPLSRPNSAQSGSGHSKTWPPTYKQRRAPQLKQHSVSSA